MLRPNSMIQKSETHVDSIPAPVGGWNARDTIANMDPSDAVTLTNFFPTTSNVVLRGGSSNFATGMTGLVQSLFVYNGAATNQMFAVDGTGSIYNVSISGAVGAPIVTAQTNSYWEYTNVTTAGGNFMLAVNGSDLLLNYDGTTWTSVNGSSAHAITGVATSTLDNTLLFKDRVWFVQKNTLNLYYLGTDAISGALSLFSLQGVARKGGYIVDIGAWTIDAGYGVDDYIVFVTSQGEVIVYGGTDPSSNTTWGLIGIWALGSPIGHRCMMKFGGDLLLMTFDGLLPLASALQSSRLDPRVALSDKIQQAMSAATDSVTNGPGAVGFEIFYYPRQNALWVNIPTTAGGQQQYAMNTITRSWCNFSGWPANCWALFNDLPYFGGNGVVCTAWDSTYGDIGANINTSALQAFNYFGARGVKKYFTRARPSIFTNGSPTVSLGLNVDFDIENNLAPITFSPSPTSTWDVSAWDQGTWGQNVTITNNWLGVTGIGYCAAIQMMSASFGLQLQWASTDIVYQAGWAGI